jgi:ribosome-associated toxin RatA of RatAB toxin-antitoxin module
MPQVTKSVLVSHSAESMFDLVDDVERYPAFLPWCGGAQVVSRDDTHTQARIEIRYLGVSQSFTTRNSKLRPQHMSLTLVEGPFEDLVGAWQFVALSPAACKVVFQLDYRFANGVIEGVIGPVMAMIAETFVDRFVQRAEALAAVAKTTETPGL